MASYTNNPNPSNYVEVGFSNQYYLRKKDVIIKQHIHLFKTIQYWVGGYEVNDIIFTNCIAM